MGNCNMEKRENSVHTTVVESLTEALLQLAAKKLLKDVNVSELCTRAGVSRVSFYRNFKSIEDILVQHLSACTNAWWEDFSRLPEQEFYPRFWPELINLYRQNQELILLLYRNDASHLLKDHIFQCCRIGQETEERESYLRAALAGAIYGMIDEWVRRGMGQIPEGIRLREIVQLLPGGSI